MIKTTRILCLFFVALTTCKIYAAEFTPKQLIDRYMAEWNRHDAKKAATYLAPNVEYFDATVGTPTIGQQAAQEQIIQVFVTAVPDLKWEMTSRPIVNKDSIAFQWRFSGKNTGIWGTTPATNKSIAFSGVSFIRIKEGKIVYQGDYYDAASLNKQLGW